MKEFKGTMQHTSETELNAYDRSAGRAAPPDDGGPRPPASESLVRFVRLVLQHRRLVAVLALIGALASALPKVIVARKYSSVASFVPRTTARGPAAFAGIAAQLGVSLPGTDATQSTAFYVDLVQSREILAAAVDSPYVVPGRAPQATNSLADLLDVTESRPLLRREKTIEKLQKALDVHANQLSGVVKLTVTTRQPWLSQEIGARLLSLVNRFNVERGQQAAEAEAALDEQRMREVREDLRTAEDRYQDFLQHNRTYQSDPSLNFQAQRLQQEIGYRQAAYTNLANYLENVRNDIERDTPVITIVQHPVLPVEPDPRGLLKAIILGLIAGLAAAIFYILIRARIDDARVASPASFEELAELRTQAVDDLRRIVAPRRRAPRA